MKSIYLKAAIAVVRLIITCKLLCPKLTRSVRETNIFGPSQSLSQCVRQKYTFFKTKVIEANSFQLILRFVYKLCTLHSDDVLEYKNKSKLCIQYYRAESPILFYLGR